jgi:hypothetical protein
MSTNQLCIISNPFNVTSFSKTTITGFKKKDAINLFENELNNLLYNESCYWLIELICSGYYDDIWDIFKYYISYNINISNPHLASYVYDQYTIFQNIKQQYKNINDLRNDSHIRKLFIKILATIISSKKNKILDNKTHFKINISKKHIQSIKSYIKANNLFLSKNIIKLNDSPQLKIVINELATHLQNKDSSFKNSLFWIKWIYKFDSINKGIYTESRDITNVDHKYYNDWIWTIWQVILNETRFINYTKLTINITALFNLFKINYNNKFKNKKIHIILHAILLIKSKINWKIPTIDRYAEKLMISTSINNLFINMKNKIKINNKNQETNTHTKINNIYDTRTKVNNIYDTHTKINNIYDTHTKVNNIYDDILDNVSEKTSITNIINNFDQKLNNIPNNDDIVSNNDESLLFNRNVLCDITKESKKTKNDIDDTCNYLFDYIPQCVTSKCKVNINDFICNSDDIRHIDLSQNRRNTKIIDQIGK